MIYICCLIITIISKIIQKIYEKQHKLLNNGQVTEKLNESNIIDGLYKHLLAHIINGTITIEIIKSYLKIIKNDKDRSFPRNSKTPFTKWNIKGYSVNSQLVKILEHILNETVSELDKNLKLIAKSISNIDKVDC